MALCTEKFKNLDVLNMNNIK